jgi:3-oxoacyl-[acyl-carrier-protein] synthase II
VHVAITGLGLVTSLGNDAATIDASLSAGRTGLSPGEGLVALLPVPGVGACAFDARPILRRKKDRKLIPRAAELAIGAAHAALTSAGLPIGALEEVGAFVGVGREPPDSGEVERALVRSARGGALDAELLATDGVAAYPPLAPLRTLPNMVLAHVAIQLGLMGEAGTRAGDVAAGLAAIHEGVLAIKEGRAAQVLAGGADSLVDAGSARDVVRLGLAGPDVGPGEGAAFVVLESAEAARARGATIFALITGSSTGFEAEPGPCPPAEPRLGWCGSADGAIDLVRQVARGQSGQARRVDHDGAVAHVAWSVA